MARILVIHHDRRAEAVREALVESGHEVHAVGSPAEAGPHAHDAAVVILPVLLPGRDSLQDLHDLRRRFANTPIITVSGRALTSADARLLEQLGATRAIEHPFQPAALLALIAATLRTGAGTGSSDSLSHR